MNPIQIILVLFFAFAGWRAVQRARRGQSSIFRVVLWVFVWTAAIAIVLQPEVTMAFAHLLGVTRGVDVPIYVSVALLFYLVFRAFAQVEDLQRQLTQIVRAQAMAEFERQLPPPPASAPAPRADA